jgi:hypothetical protein
MPICVYRVLKIENRTRTAAHHLRRKLPQVTIIGLPPNHTMTKLFLALTMLSVATLIGAIFFAVFLRALI